MVGITFQYSTEGLPVGLCKAKKLYYITTAGGNYVPDEFGFGYVDAQSAFEVYQATVVLPDSFRIFAMVLAM